jgi:hypothetical protein
VDLGYWSGNDGVLDRFEISVSGAMLRPKQAGTNEYRHLTSCAFIYSNKAQQSDAPILDVFGLCKDEITRARQDEDLKQFVMRGAIRCPDFDGTYDIYVYDLAQADVVQAYLGENGFGHVTLIGLDQVGIMDVEPPKRGRRAEKRSLERVRECQDTRREKDRLRKQEARETQRTARAAAGELRKRGRPRKQAA